MKDYCLILCGLLLLCPFINNDSLFAQQAVVWADVDNEALKEIEEKNTLTSSYRTIELKKSSLVQLLSNAPQEFSENRTTLTMELPMPNGENESFYITESLIVEEELLRKYPTFKTYKGVCTTNPHKIIRFDFINGAFHGMIKSQENTVMIDPYSDGEKKYYKSYYTDALENDEHFKCHVKDDGHHDDHHHSVHRSSVVGVGDELRTFRIAIGATGEYTTFHGGTKEDALAAIVLTLNRVNVVFESEAATRLILVGNNDIVIFTNPNTDPYTNDNLNSMIYENQDVMDNAIGLANYDVGHVFGTRGGGLAGVGVMCSTAKAWGVTGLTSPVGDVFDVVYVCHEIGHQFNAPHTFNSCGGDGGSSTAYEPGSGTTIMGYAGLCGSDNVQFGTDYFFHAASYERIVNEGNNCANIIGVSNQIPTINITDNQNLTIPISTPFTLNGTGNDGDGDDLTYTWDQIDLGPISSLGNPTGSAPLFRFYPPTSSPARTFPRMEDVVNNTSTSAEVLPTYTRDMNFRFTVRDGNMGVNFLDYTMSANAAAGPFLVTQPNAANIEWTVGGSESVTWDVANTNTAPVNCSAVDIMLSTDGGFTYPVTLASNIPNTGSTVITVPNEVGTTNRVQVKAADNVFFDISNTDFEITAPSSASILIDALSTSEEACQSTSATYTLDIQSINNGQAAINFNVLNLPTGVTVNFTPSTLVSDGTVVLTIDNLNNLQDGTYPFEIVASSSGVQSQESLELVLQGDPEQVMVATYPLAGANEIPVDVNIIWEQVMNVSSYEIEIATNINFGNSVVESSSLIGTSYMPQQLEHLTVYYWRVKALNACNEAEWSPIFSFQTVPSSCQKYTSADTPIAISSNTNGTINSFINIPDAHTIEDINITNINGTHTYVSDLTFFLTDPSGQSIQLLTPMCGEDDDFNLGLDDASVATTIDCPPTTGDMYQPINTLSTYNNNSSIGNWKLSIIDGFAQDGGALNSWEIEVCYPTPQITQPFVLNNNGLEIEPAATVPIRGTDITVILPSASDTDVSYIIKSLPQKGTLSFLGTTLQIGDSFTQADINNERVIYQHDGSISTYDDFDFEILCTNGGWLPSNSFVIDIELVEMSIVATMTQALDCHNGNNAEVTVTATGGTAPYNYSIEGSTYQSTATFGNLSAGTYTFMARDNNGIERTSNTVQILDPDRIIINVSLDSNNVTIVASGGTNNFSYSVDGNNYQNSNVFNNLDNDDYTIYVKDENDCIETDEFTILVNRLEVSSQVEQLITCATIANGKVKVQAQGGTPPYTYSVNGTGFQTDDTFDNLPPGTYTFTVQEIEGFSKTSSPIVLVAPGVVEVEAQVFENNISMTSNGGVGTHQYSLDDNVYQSSNVFSDLENGTYTIWTRDDNNCKSSTTATIAVNNIVAVAVVDNDISCKGEADGQISVLVNGGTAPYSYSINDSVYHNINAFSNLPAGSYSFTIIDADDFEIQTNPITLLEPDDLTLETSVSGNNIIAIGEGGTGNLSYSVDGQNWQENNSFSNLSNSSYTVFVKDEHGCTTSEVVTVDHTTSTAPIFDSAVFEVYPNPNQGVFMLQINEDLADDVSVSIYDLQGKLLKKYPLNNININAQKQINVSHFSNGIYQLVLSDGIKIGAKRIVINR